MGTLVNGFTAFFIPLEAAEAGLIGRGYQQFRAARPGARQRGHGPCRGSDRHPVICVLAVTMKGARLLLTAQAQA